MKSPKYLGFKNIKDGNIMLIDFFCDFNIIEVLQFYVKIITVSFNTSIFLGN